MIEAPNDLAGDLQMRRLILADRHQVCAIDSDVCCLQQRVAEEAVGVQVAIGKLLLLLLEGRYPFQPGKRRNHRQEQVKLGMLPDLTL